MNRPRFLLCVLFLLASAPNAFAKGYPSKIVIQGNGLALPIEITDRETLGKFSPWYGEFIDWKSSPAAAPTKESDSYEVLFYIDGRDKKSRKILSHMIFNFRYKPDPAEGRGVIYLPSGREDKYRVNQWTIVRDNHDGKWHYASTAWDAALKSRLPKPKQAQVVKQDVTQPRSSRYIMLASSIGGLGVLLALAMVIRRRAVSQSDR